MEELLEKFWRDLGLLQDSERFGLMLQLELKLKEREAQLALERERNDKAKKKVRQLLAKITERDRKIANLSSRLEACEASQKTKGYGDDNVKHPAGVDLALQRAQIVAQLENHLARMRQDLLESESEIEELEAQQSAKEEELSLVPFEQRSAGSMQALSMIGMQIQAKKRFGAEMAYKIKALEAQIHEQRAVIVELLSGQPRRTPVPEATVQSRAMQMPNALQAFLDVVGPHEVKLISERPLLLSAFVESQELNDDAIEGCTSEERLQILSLFTAWATVSTSALHMRDLEISEEEAEEMIGTLESCQEVKEWEMTHCKFASGALRKLMDHFGSIPLCRLNLGYCTIGKEGARLLAEVAAASSWRNSLGCLALEMNGFGDKGCKDVVSLVREHLPALSVLELGWNEIKDGSAEELISLLQAGDISNGTEGPRVLLRRLGLSGNKLSWAAGKLMLAALLDPGRELELDLSMNQVDGPVLKAVADWARARGDVEMQVRVTINLEWSDMEDTEAVKDLATALGQTRLVLAEAGQPLFQLANNELLDLEASAVLDASANLIMM